MLASIFVLAIHAAAQEPISDVELDSLVAQYKHYELPLPPASAQLVVWDPPPGDRMGDRCVGFIWGRTKAGTGKALVGTLDWSSFLRENDFWGKYERITVASQLNGIPIEGDRDWGTTRQKLTLAAGIQSAAIGRRDLARKLLSMWDDSGPSNDQSQERFVERVSMPEGLAYLAASHWALRVEENPNVRRDAYRRLQLLWREGLAKPYGDLETVYRGIELALKPNHALKGTPEWMVLDLANSTYHEERFGPDEEDPRYLAVLDLGFAAVPALIKHQQDQTFTLGTVNNMHHEPWITIGELCWHLLRDISGGEIGARDYRPTPAMAQSWWDRARKVSEEAYAVSHVVPSPSGGTMPSAGLAHLVAFKFPHRLRDVYRAVVNHRSPLISWRIADTVAGARLPVAERVSVLRLGVDSNYADHVSSALEAINRIDRVAFDKLLTSKMPRYATLRTDGGDPIRQLVGLATMTDSRAVWAAVRKTVRRMNTSRLVEVLDNLVYSDTVGKKQAIRFLMEHLTGGGGARAGKAPVRNAAATTIGSLLEASSFPPDGATPAQLFSFRQRMAKLGKAYLGKAR